MIEAPEYVTPTQLKLYHRYRDIHDKFFPPVPPRPQPKTVQAQLEQPKPLSSNVVPLEATTVRLKIILRTVCEFYGISQEAIKSHRRTHDIVMPRHMVSHLAVKLTKASLPRIGRLLGGQDHTTILHAIRVTELRVRRDRVIWEQARRLEASLRQQFGDENATPRNCIGRYVPHHRVYDYLCCGWMWAANLNEYAALMIWPCGCECVEPMDG